MENLLELAHTFAACTPYIMGVCIVFSAVKFFSNEPHYRMLTLYLVSALIVHLCMKFMGYKWGNNLILVPFFGLIELLIFTILFGKFMKLKRYSNIIYLLGLVGITFITYECLFLDFSTEAISKLQSYSRSLDAFIIVVYCMIYYFDKLTVDVNPNDVDLSFNTIMLIFFSVNLIYYLPLNFLVNDGAQNLKFYFWFAYQIFMLLFYVLFTYRIWKNGKTPKRLRYGSE